MKCVICGKTIKGSKHNAEPLAHGECCDSCNQKVLAYRLVQIMGEQFTYGNAEMRNHFKQVVLKDNQEHPAVVGSRIYIFEMLDEPSYTGATGVVEHIDDIGQLHGSWGGCAILPSEDVYIVLR